MWVVLQVLGVARGGPTEAKQHGKRRRLQKGIQNKGATTSEDIILLDKFQRESGVCGGKSDDDVMTEAAEKSQPPQPRETDPTQLRNPLINIPNCSVNSFSIYSPDEMAVEILKRTRAKTPCFWVGQLDRQDCEIRHDSAIALACEYQALLPPRSFTPCSETQPLGRTIRKVKGQQSLRDIVERDEPTISIHSDCETLVGSDTPPSPLTPTSGHFPREKSPTFSFNFDSKTPQNSRVMSPEDKSGAGFQVCLELLTDHLARGLFKKHPAEHLDRGSGLQILLMIEAYESILQHIRGEISDPRLTCVRLSHLGDIEQTLDHWLRALYSVYDRTRSNGSAASFRSCRSSFSSSSTLPSSLTEE
jgi:hypothetical protein